MNLTEAINLTRRNLSHHGLKNWRIKIDRQRNRFGACNHKIRHISLSMYLVSLNEERIVLNTILHEIAHAIVGPGHGHDSVWQETAKLIGADPKPHVLRSEIIVPDAKRVIKCRNCGCKLVYSRVKTALLCADCTEVVHVNSYPYLKITASNVFTNPFANGRAQ
jgi:predicted SprT family Zn-dependent metalloprotease